MAFSVTKYLLLLLCFFLFNCTKKKETLFKKVSSKYSNVDFVNKLTPNDSLNAFTFTNFYNGGGVGIGDFNHDNYPDLFFTGNQVNCKLYTNLGKLIFEDQTEQAGIKTMQWCNGVTVVDINQDGWDDIYISVAKHPALKNNHNLLYVNQKTKQPSFKEEAKLYGLDYDGYSTQTAFFDYDLDGDLDAYLLNTSPDVQNPNNLRPVINDGSHPSSDKLFRNETNKENGIITFKDVSKEVGVLHEGLGLGLVISDLNQDGLPDVYCSNDFISNDILYLNNGDGTFNNTIKRSMAHTSLYGMGVDAADINNDLKVDLMQLDMLPEDNERQKQMLGAQDYDRKEMSISPKYNYQLQYMRNTLQIQQGNIKGTPFFSEMGLLAGVAKTDWSWATLLTDLDNDGRKDIFITNGYRKNVTDKDFITYNKSNNYFSSNQYRKKNREELLNKIPELPLRNYAYKNTSELNFENYAETWGLDELSYANGAAYADLDLDGDLDLIINNIDNEASIFQNKSNENSNNNFLTIKLEGTQSNIHGIGAKVIIWTKGENQLFENYPTRGYLSSVEKGVFVGLGNNKHIDSLQVTWSDGLIEKRFNLKANQTITLNKKNAKSIYTKDKDKNIKNIFKPLSNILTYLHQEADFVDFTQTATLHKMLSKNGYAIAIGDLNKDKLTDLVVGGSYMGSPSTIFFQQKNGSFIEQKWLDNTKSEIGDILIFDADNDNDNDVLIVEGSNERPSIVNEAFQPVLFLNDGSGNLVKSKLFPNLNVSSQVVRVIDFDKDGDKDIFIGGRQIPNQYPLNPDSYFLRNDGGIFNNVTRLIAPELQKLGMICDALPLDYDQDDDLDLIVVGEWMAPVLIENLYGQSLVIAKKQPFIKQKGWWNCISAGDFDNDGDVDLLMGNEGLNSFYHASENEPIRLIAKDFNQDGTIDPIMGHFVKGKCVPTIPRETLTQQLVQFRRKYLMFADYAKAEFKDLFTKAELNGAFKTEANQLKSCYFENKGKGKFTTKPLPILAQQSPIYSFVVKDFDGDGHLDAVASGNFYPNEVNMGRQDASNGLFLKGNGKGEFHILNHNNSGLMISGDARKSVWLEEQKWIITSINSGLISINKAIKK